MDPFAPNHMTNGANGSSNNVDTAAQSSSPCPSETMFDKLHKHVFCVDELRQMLQTTQPVDNKLANTVQRAIEQLPKQPLDHFYPPIVVSYSTDHRKGVDAKNAGPGYVVVGCLIRYLFENGIDCYTDMMTPVGCRWTEQFMNRVDSRRAKAMIAVLSPRFFWSVNCLNEICGAKERRLKIIPVMLQEHSLREKDMWRIEDLEKYAKTHHPNNWLEIKRDLEAKRLKAIEALHGIQTVPGRGTLLSDPNALGHLKRKLQHLAQPNSQDQHPLSPHGPMSPVVPVARRVVDDSCLKVVGYKFTNYVDCDEGNNREVASCLDGLLASVQHFLQRHDDKKPIKHITAEPVTRNGKSVQLIRFDVGNMMQEMKDIARRCQKVELLLGKLAKMVDASDDEIEMFRLMAVFEGSLIVLMEAPSSFFSKIQDMFQAGGNQIVVENDIHLIGIAQAFVVTIPRDLWPKDLEELCSAMSVAAAFDLISIKKPHFSLLVPTANEAFNKLMSNDVSNWRHQNDQAWNSFPAVAPLDEAEARRRKMQLEEQRRAELGMSFLGDGMEKAAAEDCNEKTQNVQKASEIDESSSADFTVSYSNNDVLVGRFKFCRENGGNRKLRDLVRKFYPAYEVAGRSTDYDDYGRKPSKNDINKMVVARIMAHGGRFIKITRLGEQVMSSADSLKRVAAEFKRARKNAAQEEGDEQMAEDIKDNFQQDGDSAVMVPGSIKIDTTMSALSNSSQHDIEDCIMSEGQGLQGRSQSTDRFFQGSSSTPPVASQDDLLSVDMSVFNSCDESSRSSVGE